MTIDDDDDVAKSCFNLMDTVFKFFKDFYYLKSWLLVVTVESKSQSSTKEFF